MKQIGMKEKRIPRLHFAINTLLDRQAGSYPFRIGTHLFAGQAMGDPAQPVGTPNHLEATILFTGRGKSHIHAEQIGEQKSVIVPIPIILMPFPGTSYFWLFLHDLGMKMSDRTAQKCFYRIDHAVAAGKHAVYVIAGRVPRRELGAVTLFVK